MKHSIYTVVVCTLSSGKGRGSFKSDFGRMEDGEDRSQSLGAGCSSQAGHAPRISSVIQVTRAEQQGNEERN